MYAFVVPTYDKPWLSKKCLETLFRTEPGDDWFAVVVNDGARAPAPEAIRRQFEGNSRVEVILKPRNEGFSKTCNAGIRRAIERGAARVVLVNDDIEFTQPVIPALDRAFSSGGRVGVVGAKLLYPDGTLQHAGMARSGRLIGHRYYQMPGSHPPANEPKEGAVTGALIAMSSDLVAQIGGLDEGYFMTCEDTDYCVSATRAGWKVIYWPEFTAIHAEGATRGRTNREKSAKYRSAEILGYARLYGRWGHEVKEAVKVGPRPAIHWCLEASGLPETAVAVDAAKALEARGWSCEFWRVAPDAQGPRYYGTPEELARWLRGAPGIKIACSPSLSTAVLSALDPGDRGFALVLQAVDAVSRELRPLCPSAETARDLGLRGYLEPSFIGWCVRRSLFEGTLRNPEGEILIFDPDLSAKLGPFRAGRTVLDLDSPNVTGAVWVHAAESRAHVGSLVRAMAAGIPVVAIASPENRSVASSRDAVLVAPDEIPEAIDRLLADRPLADQLSLNARKSAGRHAWHVTADCLEDVFDRPDPKPERIEKASESRSFAALGSETRAFASSKPRRTNPPPARNRNKQSMSSLGAKPARGWTSSRKRLR